MNNPVCTQLWESYSEVFGYGNIMHLAINRLEPT